VIIGAAAAVLAWAFTVILRASGQILLEGIAGYRPPGLAAEGEEVGVIGPYGLWLVPLVTALGGLVVGVLTVWLAPEAEGHGTDAAVRSFHRQRGRLRGRVAPLKIVTSAITIGSGGSAGREGPIALSTAALSSWYADRMGRSEEDRRLLLLVGAAAGIAAIFRSPIGAALFTVEVLYADMEFEAGALLYATLSAIVAYALSGLVTGFGALFVVPTETLSLARPVDYGWYVVLGIAAGIVATMLPVLFYRVRDFFRKLPVPAVTKPAIGGLLTGLIALALPQVIAGGYGWMQAAIDGRLGLGLLIALVLAKMVAMSLTIASGGSGGVFAPSLFVGTMLGAACAAVAGLSPAPLAVVGMAAVFAGAAHVPFAAMMMVVEMTGGYTLLVPAALAVLLSYLVQHRLSAGLPYRSIYEAQVGSRSESPAHHTEHLSIALRILRERRISDLEHLGNLDLITVLQSGLSVDIGEGRHLLVGVLRADSPLAGATIAQGGPELAEMGVTILGILRQEHMIAPRGATVLQAGDRLVLVSDDEAIERLRRHLEPW
jgi:CIC family chloride channel protein